MSVNLVQKKVIDAIVTAYVEKSNFVPPPGLVVLGVPKEKQDEVREVCTKLGQMLWDVNYDAYNRRYTEENETPVYVFEPKSIGWPEHLLVIISIYQTEIQEAQGGDGFAFAERHCNDLRARLVRKLKVYTDCEEEIRRKYR